MSEACIERLKTTGKQGVAASLLQKTHSKYSRIPRVNSIKSGFRFMRRIDKNANSEAGLSLLRATQVYLGQRYR